MTKNKGKLRVYFNKELEDLQQELHVTITQRNISERLHGDRGDTATRFIERNRLLARIEYLTGQIADMERALVKLNTGTYGICDVCGGTIPQARLEIIPQANLCLNCKHDQNRKDRKAQVVPAY